MFEREAFVINLCGKKPMVYKAQKPKGYPRPDLPDYIGEPEEYMDEPTIRIREPMQFGDNGMNSETDSEYYNETRKRTFINGKGKSEKPEIRRLKDKEKIKQMTIENQQISNLETPMAANENRSCMFNYRRPNPEEESRMKQVRFQQHQINSLLAPQMRKPPMKKMTVDVKGRKPTFNPKHGAGFYDNKYSRSWKTNLFPAKQKARAPPPPDMAYPPADVIPPSVKTTTMLAPEQLYQTGNMASVPIISQNQSSKYFETAQTELPKLSTKSGFKKSKKTNREKSSKKVSTDSKMNKKSNAKGNIQPSNNSVKNSNVKQSLFKGFPFSISRKKTNEKNRKRTTVNNNNNDTNTNNESEIENDNDEVKNHSVSSSSSSSSLDTQLSLPTKRRISAFKKLLKYILDHDYPADQAIGIAYDTVMQGYSYETMVDDQTTRLINKSPSVYTFAASSSQQIQPQQNEGTQTAGSRAAAGEIRPIMAGSDPPHQNSNNQIKGKKRRKQKSHHRSTCRKTSAINSNNLLNLVRKGFTYEQLASCPFDSETMGTSRVKERSDR